MRVLRMMLVILTLAVLGGGAQAAFAQTARPTGPTEGSVSGTTYTWPQAGFRFTLPAAWNNYGYHWYETWGSSASATAPGAAFISNWTFAPKVQTTGEVPLVVIYVYPKAEWDKIAAQPGPKPQVWAEGNGYVYTASTPQANPYDPASVDGRSFDALVAAISALKASFATIGGATPPTTTPGTTPPPAAGATTTADVRSRLVGPVWQWTSFNDAKLGAQPITGPQRYTAQFMADGSVAILADCNNVRATYTLDGQSIRITLGPSTLAACPPDSRADQFTAGLAAARIVSFQGNNMLLDLFADSGTMVFTPAPTASQTPPDPAKSGLTGATWRWTDLTTNTPTAIITEAVANPEQYTIQFMNNGTVAVRAACIQAVGTYTMTGNGGLSIKIGPTTLALCPGDTREFEFIRLLGEVHSYAFRDGMLLLDYSGDKSGKMWFSK